MDAKKNSLYSDESADKKRHDTERCAVRDHESSDKKRREDMTAREGSARLSFLSHFFEGCKINDLVRTLHVKNEADHRYYKKRDTRDSQEQ